MSGVRHTDRLTKNEDDLTQQRYMTLHVTQKMKTTSLYNEMEWSIYSGRNGMEAIPFQQEWNGQSIPAGMEWSSHSGRNGMEAIPFLQEWNGQSIPAGMEWSIHCIGVRNMHPGHYAPRTKD